MAAIVQREMKMFSAPLQPILQYKSLFHAMPLQWNCMIPTLTWTLEGVRFIDQTKLPLEESYVLATTYEQVADVIVTMVVRGAPAIGVSAAYGVALGTIHSKAESAERFAPEFEKICARLAGTRWHAAKTPPRSCRAHTLRLSKPRCWARDALKTKRRCFSHCACC